MKDIATVRTVVNGHASIVAAFGWKVLHARKVVPRAVLSIHVKRSNAQLAPALKKGGFLLKTMLRRSFLSVSVTFGMRV